MVITLGKMKESKQKIDSLVSYGVEKLSITIQTRCVDGTVSLISDLERFKKMS